MFLILYSRQVFDLLPKSSEIDAKVQHLTGHNIRPPTPCDNIPFPRDQDLVVRGSILDQIHGKCTRAISRTALVGLGGVG